MNLKKYFDAAISYDDYINLLGDNLSLHKLHYRKFEPLPDIVEKIRSIQPVKILAITEPWCADSMAMLPILSKLAETAGTWTIRVALRDENPELMEKFLTNGARAIPMFLFLNEANELLFVWGPRIKMAQEIFENHRAEINSGFLDKSEVIKKIRVFYAKDRGKHAVEELISLFSRN